jgi:tRNA(adenine34) deaminase
MPLSDSDEHFMRRALILAAAAAEAGEVPVGAVLVQGGQVVGEGFNQPISHCDPTAHAEIVALRAAAAARGNYRLPDTTLYVTIEPCTMCVGALVHARVARVVFGAPEPKAGALVSQLQLAQAPHWNHRLEFTGGVCADAAAELMQNFFRQRRLRKESEPRD